MVAALSEGNIAESIGDSSPFSLPCVCICVRVMVRAIFRPLSGWKRGRGDISRHGLFCCDHGVCGT